MTKLKLNNIMYKFKEYNLDKNFAKSDILAVTSLIHEVNSLQIVGIANSGISIFIKYLTSLPLGKFIYVDSYALALVIERDFWALVLTEFGGDVTAEDTIDIILEKIREQLVTFADKNERIIIVFNRFDQLSKLFSAEFFNRLRAIQRVLAEQLVMVYAVCKPVHLYNANALEGANLGFFSNIFYLHPYATKDIYYLYEVFGPAVSDERIIDKAIALSGGHYQLFQFLLKSDRIATPLDDQFVKLAVQDIYNRFTTSQQKELEKIVQGKSIGSVDDYLLQVGFIKQTEVGFEIFSPVVRDYILRKSSKLPKKEARLFALLKKYRGSVVSKDMIMKAVWRDEVDEMSDWALNSLVYRLKNNPAFLQTGYSIENYKGVGYLLSK